MWWSFVELQYFLCASPFLLIVCVELKKIYIKNNKRKPYLNSWYVSTHHFWVAKKCNSYWFTKCCAFILQPRISDNYYGDLKDITVPTLTTQHSNKVSQFHKTLKNATGKKLLKLQVNFKKPKHKFHNSRRGKNNNKKKKKHKRIELEIVINLWYDPLYVCLCCFFSLPLMLSFFGSRRLVSRVLTSILSSCSAR